MCLILLRARATSAGSLGVAGGTFVASPGSSTEGTVLPLLRVQATKIVKAATNASAERTRRRERIRGGYRTDLSAPMDRVVDVRERRSLPCRDRCARPRC